MKSTFGEHIQISLFGESHGAAIGVNINGLAPGIKLDLDFIRAQLNKRKPKGKISTPVSYTHLDVYKRQV